MFRSRALPFDPRTNKIASLQSLKFHHGGLCEDYVSALNRDIVDTPIQNADLFTIITQSFKEARGEECEFSQISKLYQICLGFSRIFNNASEIYNHDFYFDCIAQPSEPSGELADALAQAFGGIENFKSEFLKRALGLFGSGWCWLACDERGANLEIITTQNADTPIVHGKIPLLACDLWEHAYYADHQNARKFYVESFLHFADFGFASDAYSWAKKQGLGSVRLSISASFTPPHLRAAIAAAAGRFGFSLHSFERCIFGSLWPPRDKFQAPSASWRLYFASRILHRIARGVARP